MKDKDKSFVELLNKPGTLERLGSVALSPLPGGKMRVPKQTKRGKKIMKRVAHNA
jgi:hypothetical protein